MRRYAVLLSAVLAAGSAALPETANAVPLCYSARVEGSLLTTVDTGQHCVPYAYGVHCEYGHTWYHPFVHVYTEACIPR